MILEGKCAEVKRVKQAEVCGPVSGKTKSPVQAVWHDVHTENYTVKPVSVSASPRKALVASCEVQDIVPEQLEMHYPKIESPAVAAGQEVLAERLSYQEKTREITLEQLFAREK